MIEIRTIREAEAPDFLRLLCEVFELDYDRASGVFFHEPMFDLRRKWGLFESGEMVSILTTVPLEFGWGKAIGIAGVATVVSRQGKGLAGTLLERVLNDSEKMGESAALLFAREKGLYERCGFEVIDEVVRAEMDCEVDDRLSDSLMFDEVQEVYTRWSHAHPGRLRRDERRWKFWKWNLRVCASFGDGYVCHEGKVIREIVVPTQPPAWKMPPNVEWVGLRSMAANLGLSLRKPETELYLMGLRSPGIPQMFMTDQF
jgi:N-acetylglutamate synthase-like GNAT family acetyltransferase